MNCLYILEIKTWFIATFANVFSHSVGFFLFMVSFAVQKLLGLIRSPFVYFCFCFNYSRRWIQKKNIAAIDVKECSAVFLWEFYGN